MDVITFLSTFFSLTKKSLLKKKAVFDMGIINIRLTNL